jgi:hypothetical protein
MESHEYYLASRGQRVQGRTSKIYSAYRCEEAGLGRAILFRNADEIRDRGEEQCSFFPN